MSLHEFFYPLMQGFDSVEIKADIELGGTDQRFNVLMGRALQKEFNQEPQVTIFMPLLEGLDGKDKMSKSLGNYIGIDEQANVMYEKAMTIPDELIIKYFELVTDIHPDVVDNIKLDLEENRVNPRDIKMNLAKEIVKLYHEEEKAIDAENRFKEVFQKGQIPNDIQTIEVLKSEFDLIDELVKNKLVSSKSEVRRLITQGGIKVNNEKLDDIKNININETIIVQVGKKKFIKICLK
ncbi:tyrosine--tRNA ligase [Paraclostridium benzoelyticum]